MGTVAAVAPQGRKLYTYDTIRQVHLEPTTRCQAACPMCARNVAGGRTRDCLKLDEITLTEFRQWFPDDFLRGLSSLFMCGNFGEPVMARDCLEIYAHCRSLRQGLWLGLNTNGGARSTAFWRELARLRVKAIFGIDGAGQETHQLYRRQTDFDRIMANAAAFIAAGGVAVWEFLVFRHNEHEVETARDMARRMGFVDFRVKPTRRFQGAAWHQVRDRDGSPAYRLEPSPMFAPQAAPPELPAAEVRQIVCEVAAKQSVFVSASGLVFPCCYLGYLIFDRPGAPDSQHGSPRMARQLDPFLDLVDSIGVANLDLHHRSLRAIVDRYLPAFADAWAPGPGRLITCAEVCGTPCIAAA